jgi:hypothetical protein
MRKYTLFISLIFALILSGKSYAQSVSLDFTRTDCDGTEHTLYSELDGGKVVILDFVMLGCSSCIIGSNGLNKIYNNFESTNPGRVKFYAFGYDDNYTCTQLRSWVTDNHFNALMFEDGAQQTGYYGGMGMPTIVVTATNTHTILYKKLGYAPSDDDAIIAAIDIGLKYTPQAANDLKGKELLLYPSVFTDRFTVKLPKPVTGWISLYDLTGQQVLKVAIEDTDELVVDATQVRAGLYFATVFSETGSLGSYKLIKK